MFTGIIEEIGVVEGLERSGSAAQLTIRASKVLGDVRNGDSISTNGVCLTVVRFTKETFTADVMPETLRYSNLGALKKGSQVNLERAMSANGRFGGHMVSGHIDGVGVIRALPMDGTSLTVAQLEGAAFSVSIIPVTKDETILLQKRVGDEINLECDLVGKYVERLLQFAPEKKSRVTMDFLKENGFA